MQGVTDTALELARGLEEQKKRRDLSADQTDATIATTLPKQDDGWNALKPYVRSILNEFSALQHKRMVRQGFTDTKKQLLDLITLAQTHDLLGPDQARELRFGLKTLTKLSKYALMVSEIGEAIEGVRKSKPNEPVPSDHLSEHSLEEEENADLFIRLADYSGENEQRLGDAVVRKVEFNANRPYRHGKNS